ncbi:hypothetical protein GOBAR_DD26191 [Gossypium barbadense]|nr:hypothetical protein GOBAR_DD26191 [Gossypium barbadense]
MVVDSNQQPIMSFKDKLLGGGVASSDGNLEGIFEKDESHFELMEGDVNMSMVNGIPAVAFSDRIKDILFKEMELTVILKLLGRNIGYNVLHNRILNLWKPAKSFHLMDTTNEYFLVKFQDIDDYNKVLTQGPWIIFGQYLTMQPWTKIFNPTQPYHSMVMAWIHLSSLPEYLYKRKIIEAIGGLIEKFIKLDLQTDNRTKGRVEYEALPTVYFCCGKYGHVKELCLLVGENLASGSSVDVTVVVSREDGSEEMRVDYRLMGSKVGKGSLGSRFLSLIVEGALSGDLGGSDEGFLGEKGEGSAAGGLRGFAQVKCDDVRMSKPSNVKLGGPSEVRPG